MMNSTFLFLLFYFLLLIDFVDTHWHTAYAHWKGDVTAWNPNWMANLDDLYPIKDLSIPGTHDSCSLYGGDAVQTQAMSITQQLNAGIRFLDIRLRHYEDRFPIHHGFIYQDIDFNKVLDEIRDFFKKHPSETVLMRVKEEYTAAENKKEFVAVFNSYVNEYVNIIWLPKDYNDNNPTLGEVRGKIVFLINFPDGKDFGINYGIFGGFEIQDDYAFPHNWYLHEKWDNVKTHLDKADANSNKGGYINYLSGSGWSFPYFVASGHSSPGTSAPRLATGAVSPFFGDWKFPDFDRVSCFCEMCTIAFEGTNILAYKYIQKLVKSRCIQNRPGKICIPGYYVGIIVADFPGNGLIDSIINVNYNMSRYAKPDWTRGHISGSAVENRLLEIEMDFTNFGKNNSGNTNILYCINSCGWANDNANAKFSKRFQLENAGKNCTRKLISIPIGDNKFEEEMNAGAFLVDYSALRMPENPAQDDDNAFPVPILNLTAIFPIPPMKGPEEKPIRDLLDMFMEADGKLKEIIMPSLLSLAKNETLQKTLFDFVDEDKDARINLIEAKTFLAESVVPYQKAKLFAQPAMQNQSVESIKVINEIEKVILEEAPKKMMDKFDKNGNRVLDWEEAKERLSKINEHSFTEIDY